MGIRHRFRLRARPADVGGDPPPPPPPPPPPTGDSPLDRGVHPRLFLAPEDMDTVADRIMNSASLTADLTTLAGQVAGTIAISPSTDGTTLAAADHRGWKMFNASFLALMHEKLTARGFTWPTAVNTAAKCATIAYDQYANSWRTSFIAGGKPWDSGNFNQEHGYMSADGIGAPGYVCLGVLWDWCLDHLTPAQRTDLAVTFESWWVDRVEPTYDPDRLYYPAQNLGNMLIQNQNAQGVEPMVYALAFCRDTADIDATVLAHAEVYARGYWTVLEAEVDDFFPENMWGYEGFGYMADAYADVIWPVLAAQSAFGDNWVEDKPYFTTYYKHVTGMVHTSAAIDHGRIQCGHWGSQSSDGMENAADITWMLGNLLAASAPDTAAVLRYVWENWEVNTTEGGLDWPKTRSVWAAAVRFKFLRGTWENVAAVNPHTRTDLYHQKLGFGAYAFRSGFDQASSKVFFQANNFAAWGHHGGGYGDWGLYKQGNLILQMGVNGKSGAGSTAPSLAMSQRAVNHSNLYVHPTAVTDINFGPPYMSGTGWKTPTNNSALTRAAGAKTMITNPVRGEKCDGGAYGYVWFDGASIYNGATHGCTGMATEFVYLGGAEDHEFVVRLDRSIVSNTSTYTRTMQLWVPVEPVYEDGTAPTEDTADIAPFGSAKANYPVRSRVKKTSTDVTKFSVTNQGASIGIYGQNSGARDGKLYLTLVSMPAVYTVTSSGGDYVELQDHAFAGYAPLVLDAARYPSAGFQQLFGWGRIQIDSATTEDPYLLVGQLGKASTMSAQKAVVKIASVDGNDLGAHIQDTSNEWVVMFARGYAAANTRRGATVFTITPVSGSFKVLVTNRVNNASYGVSYSGGTITIAASGGTTVTASGQGVLEFTVTVSGAVITPGVS